MSKTVSRKPNILEIKPYLGPLIVVSSKEKIFLVGICNIKHTNVGIEEYQVNIMKPIMLRQS